MSFASLVDALRTGIPTLTGFTAKTELANAYDPASCGENMLRDGWGLTFGAATETGAEYGDQIVNAHNFSVVLAREVVSIEGDPEPLMTAIKAIKADALTLQREVLSSDRMGLPDAVEALTYQTTDAVVFGQLGEDYKWLRTAVNFNVAIRESL